MFILSLESNCVISMEFGGCSMCCRSPCSARYSTLLVSSPELQEPEAAKSADWTGEIPKKRSRFLSFGSLVSPTSFSKSCSRTVFEEVSNHWRTGHPGATCSWNVHSGHQITLWYLIPRDVSRGTRWPRVGTRPVPVGGLVPFTGENDRRKPPLAIVSHGPTGSE